MLQFQQSLEVCLLAMNVHLEPTCQAAEACMHAEACMDLLQAQKLQKRELRQQKGAEDEDARMGSGPRNNQRKRRKAAHGDVEMADAEVCQVLG